MVSIDPHGPLPRLLDPPQPPWVKVCGVTDPETAVVCAATGVSAIGLNFFEPSPRSVTPAVAETIVAALPENVATIGLFVNHTPVQIAAITDRVRFTALQLHGDETPADLAEIHSRLPELPLIRAFRIGPSGMACVAESLSQLDSLRVPLAACLIDAAVAGTYGGTGERVCWDTVASEYDRANWPPLILAGGLRPANVAAAVRQVRPWGIDTASGVESAPAVKSPTLIADFVRIARQAADTELREQ